jgi:dTDP-4-amino-4,6-dideoxygalactose transaminase
LLINDERFVERAETIREKGTNRSSFFRGQVDKYTWVDIGSSYLPGELIAAFLLAQLEEAAIITRKRLEIWDNYHAALGELERQGVLRTPHVPKGCIHNAHMYYLLLSDLDQRTQFIKTMKKAGISTVFHYIPLHSSPAGREYCHTSGSMKVTDAAGNQLVRLPVWIDMTDSETTYVIDNIWQYLGGVFHCRKRVAT